MMNATVTHADATTASPVLRTDVVDSSTFLSSADLARLLGLHRWNPVVPVLASVLRLRKLNALYTAIASMSDRPFLEAFFEQTQIRVEVGGVGGSAIPAEGPVVIVANHPFGAVDGLALLWAVQRIRPDVRVMANRMLGLVTPLRDKWIEVDPLRTSAAPAANTRGFRECMRHLQDGRALIVFPAGEVSAHHEGPTTPVDKPWDTSVMKLIQRVGAPVVPVHIPGTNSSMFYRLGQVHPRLRTLALPSELLNKVGTTINLTFGNAIPWSDLARINEPVMLARHLRSRVYALGAPSAAPVAAADLPAIAAGFAPSAVAAEIGLFRDACMCGQGEFDVYLIPGDAAPAVLHEVGRRREITFRAVGEGTGTALDIDDIDRWYEHLVLWHRPTQQIAGAYRLGHGGRIAHDRGVDGLYTTTLFAFDAHARTLLASSLELGRSFVIPEFQRHRLPLFLLWQGILTYLERHPELRRVIGPVSISADYSTVSKQLMAAFFQGQSDTSAFAGRVEPHCPLPPPAVGIDLDALLAPVGNDLRALDKLVRGIEGGAAGVPVLVRKYAQQHAMIVAFSQDPAFCNSLDGFMVLEVSDIPEQLRAMAAV
jgi:putative hemolysin